MKRIVTLVLLVWFLIFTLTICHAQTILNQEIICTYSNKEFAESISDLAKQSHVEILVDPTITGKVSIDLGKTTLGNALDRICSLAGVFYGPVGEKSVVIASGNPKGPYFFAVERAKRVKINNIKVKQLMNLMANNPYVGFIAPDEELNQISIVAPLPIIERIIADIAQFDQEKLQIIVEAVFLDTSGIETKDLGMNFNLTQGKKNPDGVWTIQWANNIFGFTDTRHGRILATLFNFASQDNLKTLSQPKITVQDGENATIFFGRETYIPISTVYGAAPAKIEPIKSGTELTIKLRVIEDNQLLVDLKGDVSDVIGTGSTGIPIINRRTINSTLRIKDGVTIIAGGLATSLEYKIRNRVPILSEIPLVGALFTNSHKENRKQEITILITPRIIRPETTPLSVEKALEKAKEKVEQRTPLLEGEKTPSITTERETIKTK